MCDWLAFTVLRNALIEYFVSGTQHMYQTLGVIVNVHYFYIRSIVHMLCGLTDRFKVSMKTNQQ